MTEIRKDLVTHLSEEFERLASARTDLTEEEQVTTLVLAAFGLAHTEPGYRAFWHAIGAATKLMDRVGLKDDPAVKAARDAATDLAILDQRPDWKPEPHVVVHRHDVVIVPPFSADF